MHARSVAANGVLPCAEQVGVVVLLTLNASLVLNLSKLGCTLLVHAILQVTTHRAVSLSDLPEDISLVSLLV